MGIPAGPKGSLSLGADFSDGEGFEAVEAAG